MKIIDILDLRGLLVRKAEKDKTEERLSVRQRERLEKDGGIKGYKGYLGYLEYYEYKVF